MKTSKTGQIVLRINTGLHAADMLAAEKIEAWLNTVGLDTAAELLPLNAELPAKAGPTQLSFPYANAA